MSLGVECGATGSSALLLSPEGDHVLKQGTFGPANYNLLTEQQLEQFFQKVKSWTGSDVPPLSKVGVGMPGVGDHKARETLSKILRNVWPNVTKIWVGSDADTAMACLKNSSDLKVIVIAGTGSNCHAQHSRGNESKIGGYGHVMGDRGSSYWIAQQALRLALREFEHECPLGGSQEENKQLREVEHMNPCLLRAILLHLGMASLPELAKWSVSCSKNEMAALAVLVLREWRKGNKICQNVIEEALNELSEDCSCLVTKFLEKSNAAALEIGLTGSLFTKNEDFAQGFRTRLELLLNLQAPKKLTFRLLQNTAQGALRMVTDFVSQNILEKKSSAPDILPEWEGLPPSECRNPESMTLDTMSISQGIALMLREEATIHTEISNHAPAIEQLIQRVSHSFRNGGRLFYVGAGTSGRLGVLDASECPPTFKAPPHWVQGIIAGGAVALTKAVEGAEDSVADGGAAVEEREVEENDVVLGIAASGRTPFVWGAMHRASTRGAFTALLTFNTKLRFRWKPEMVLAMHVGPEVLTGSTRLKCGTATKLVLNMLTTLAMVQVGKVFENLMVDLSPANQKLRDRALRIVLLMTQGDASVDNEKAATILRGNGYDIRKTVQQLRNVH